MPIGRAFGIKTIVVRWKSARSGGNVQGDLNGFEELGIKVDWLGNVLLMQVPIVGTVVFMKEWAAEKKTPRKGTGGIAWADE